VDERRRFPRRVADGQLAVVPTLLDVQVLDISEAGVLLQSPQSLDVGTRGSLRLNLAGSVFAADVRVQRVSAPSDAASGVRMALTFVSIGPGHRELIERFVTH